MNRLLEKLQCYETTDNTIVNIEILQYIIENSRILPSDFCFINDNSVRIFWYHNNELDAYCDITGVLSQYHLVRNNKFDIQGTFNKGHSTNGHSNITEILETYLA